MVRSRLHLVIYFWFGIHVLALWLQLLFLWFLWGTKLRWSGGVWFEFKKDSWPARTWFKGQDYLSFGYGGGYYPGRSGIKSFEDPKEETPLSLALRQTESATLLGLLISASVAVNSIIHGQSQNWLFLFCIWFFSGSGFVLSSMLVAFLRDKKSDNGPTIEDEIHGLVESWEQHKTTGRKTSNVARRYFK